jgi:hypothetical protein
MMTIKDLSISKELDSKAMTEVRGGAVDFNTDTAALLAQSVASGGGIGSPAIGLQLALPISINTGVDLADLRLPFSR